MQKLDTLATDFGKSFMRMHRLFDRRLGKCGASLARTKLLMFVDREGPARAIDIAEYFGHSPRTVTEALDGLERDGLVRRDPDPADRRVKRVSVTEEGRRAIAATEPLRLRLVERVFGVLDDEDRQCLAKILRKLATSLENEEREP